MPRGFSFDDYLDADDAAEPVEVENVVCFGSTARALNVRLPNQQTRWVPRTVVTADSEVQRSGESGTLIVERWWAEESKFEDAINAEPPVKFVEPEGLEELVAYDT